jgi:phosphoribosylaminoimidazolecarboxamide formyltransferase/IMP cyclohydrolase
MSELYKIRRALISVSDKKGLERLGLGLKKLGVEIISSGGTGKFLSEKGIDFTPVETVTGNPEAFSGRMKTLSFQIGSSLLYRRSHSKDILEAAELGIEPIDLVVCNLYPFDEVVKRGGELEELIENIDIGGPTMIRAAAKNHESICTCTNVSQYDLLLEALEDSNGNTDLSMRKNFAMDAFRHTAAYDGMIASVLEKEFGAENRTLVLAAKNSSPLRYGENPHQKGWVYQNNSEDGLAHAKPVQGKAMSYNNLLDADAALRCTSDLHSLCIDEFKYAVTIVKHLNPCGASLGREPLEALQSAWDGDPISAFGSILCFNRPVNLDTANWLSSKFVEVIIAPEFSSDALDVFAKKKNLRLLKSNMLSPKRSEMMVRSISGGFVVQNEDLGVDLEFQSMTDKKFASEHISLAQFGIFVGKHLRSNAIALVKQMDNGLSLIGAGMGNPNRLISLTQATDKARENGHTDLKDAVLISDAFFPFQDTVEAAHSEGILNIVQPGGSIRDEEVITRANELGVTMAFTGRRHFRH